MQQNADTRVKEEIAFAREKDMHPIARAAVCVK